LYCKTLKEAPLITSISVCLIVEISTHNLRRVGEGERKDGSEAVELARNKSAGVYLLVKHRPMINIERENIGLHPKKRNWLTELMRHTYGRQIGKGPSG
jgi:hypothetical protein